MNGTLVEEGIRSAKSQEEVWKALNSFARDLGISVDHVIFASLRMVAEEYEKATGAGTIPCLF